MPSSAPQRGIETSHALAQAIVDTVREPLLVLDKDLCVIVASQSLYRDFEVDPSETLGRSLYELGERQWDIPSLRVFFDRAKLDEGVAGDCEVESEFPRIGNRIFLLNVRKLLGPDSDGAMLVTVNDVTQRRAIERERDELLKQKQMLLEEMEHRVSNSLQIIASILLMKARAVNSEETRAYLHDAHKRVLAVAAVQKHLHASTSAEAVLLEPYLTQLCGSLAGAMIPEEEGAVAISVTVSGGKTTSSAAVSLGLIITELVINALKHAFPALQPGRAIIVAYEAEASDWTLTVADNGIGKSHLGPADVKGGLGTSLVNALATQLDAHISTKSSAAGTSVSIIHLERPKAV